MSQQIKKTDYPPEKLTMVWDGDCGFCKYWKMYWEKITAPKIQFKPYQEVADEFPDISVQHFKDAVRLIDRKGRVFSGPNAAYRAYFIVNKYPFLYRWYSTYSIFHQLSDTLYQLIADNRSFMYKLSVFLFGKNPLNMKAYWLIYLLLLVFLIFLIYFW